MAKTISMYSLKGGTGKTVISYLTSLFLSRNGARVLVVDMDMQGTLSLALVSKEYQDVAFEKNVHLLFHSELFNSEPETIIYPTEFPYIDILPSSIVLASTEAMAYTIFNNGFRLHMFLSKVRQKYDFIIIDNPPQWNIFTMNSMATSDYVVIPTTPEYYSFESVRIGLNMLNDFRKFKQDLYIAGAVINLLDKRYKESEAFVSIMPKALNLSVLGTLNKRVVYQRMMFNKKLAVQLLSNPTEEISEFVTFINNLITTTEEVVANV